MKRKKFVKNMMSVGVGRNAANWICREGGRAGTILMAQAMNLPGAYCVSGVFKTRDGIRVRVKGVNPERIVGDGLCAVPTRSRDNEITELSR